jgi:periplasmic divalent cation tolerance protein
MGELRSAPNIRSSFKRSSCRREVHNPGIHSKPQIAMKETVNNPILVLSTASAENAEVIARSLVEEHLAACVNMTPVRSMYYWQGEFSEDTEVMMVIKTMESRKIAVLNKIRELHTYELPEMIVIPVTGGFPPYLTWIGEETRQGRPPGAVRGR